MLKSIRNLLSRQLSARRAHTDERAFDTRYVAAAALLVEAAWLDSDFANEERQTIVRLVEERFGLPFEHAKALVAHAEQQQGEAYSGWQFIKSVREGFEPELRADVVEMLWQVALADGTLRPFEKQMVERVGEELDLAPDLVAAARTRAQKRLAPEG